MKCLISKFSQLIKDCISNELSKYNFSGGSLFNRKTRLNGLQKTKPELMRNKRLLQNGESIW